MVGVPRSKGCSTCRSRRIKCDEVRPECGQCRRYGSTCPGYNRGLKFQDEGPNLQRRHHRKTDRKLDNNEAERKSSPEATSASTSTSTSASAPSSSSALVMTDKMMAEVGGEEALRLMRTHASSIDESLSPHLVKRLFMSQQPRLFHDFTCAAFPTLYFHNRFRSANFGFPEHITKIFHTKPYLDSAVCCLSAVYLASLTKDNRLLRSSRYMYGEALRRVNRIIDTDEALSDSVLSTVMMLSIYELYARTTPDAWVKHARGVREMFIRRGPKKHMSGLGRSCYYAYRGFLVAHALHQGIPCILDEDEWQNFAIQIQQEDEKKPGEWSVFVHISEYVFMELVKCPRHVYDVRHLSSDTPRHEVVSLFSRIRATRANLLVLSEELRASIMYHFQKKQGIEVDAKGFVGPAPALFPDTNPTLLLQGAMQCLDILEKLLQKIQLDSSEIAAVAAATAAAAAAPSEVVSAESRVMSSASPPDSHTTVDGSDCLFSTPSADSTCETVSSAHSSPGNGNDIVPPDPSKVTTYTLPFRLVSEIGRGPANGRSQDHGKSSSNPVVWLDHIACSMGMLGSDIIEEEEGQDVVQEAEEV